jgi:elongation factor Ts
MNLTAEMVRELRERSGEGLMSCKKALLAHNGDVEGALEHLRCEGQAVVRRGAYLPCGCDNPSRGQPK